MDPKSWTPCIVKGRLQERGEPCANDGRLAGNSKPKWCWKCSPVSRVLRKCAANMTSKRPWDFQGVQTTAANLLHLHPPSEASHACACDTAKSHSGCYWFYPMLSGD